MGNFFSRNWDPEKDMPDLTGKIAVVTGANIGMGFVISEQLALNGAKVYMGARSAEKAKDAIALYEKNNATTKNKGEIVYLPLDLSKPTYVIESAKWLLENEKKVDVLVNNAARLASDFVLTEDGVELSQVTNHIGHFLLTTEILPLLKAAAKDSEASIRIVTIGSGLHAVAKCPPLNDISAFNTTYSATVEGNNGTVAKTKRYGLSKLFNTLFAKELQRRLTAEGVNAVSLSLHPGIVFTQGALDTVPRFIHPLFYLIGKNALQGATSALFAATAPEVDKKEVYKGSYLGPFGKLLTPNAEARDEKLAKDLWTLTEKFLADVKKKSL